MKIKTLTLVVSAVLLLVSCGTKTATVTPPTTTAGPSKTVLALDGIEIACDVAAADVSPAVAAWLGECPVTINTTIAAISSTNTISTVSIITGGITQFLNAAPTTGLSTQDVTIIKSITVAVQTFLALYQQQTAAMPPAFAESFMASRGMTLSAADKKQLKATRSKAKELAKKFPRKKAPAIKK